MNQAFNVFVVHYSPLTERLHFMQNQLSRLGISYTLITDEPHENWIVDDATRRHEKTKTFSGFMNKTVTKNETSLAWKHLVFIKHASMSNQPSLVLEDDAILSENFADVINDIVKTGGWDAVFPGSGCNLRLHDRGLIRVNHPASKCTDSYVLTPAAAKALLETMNESVDLPIDWELNFQMMHHDLKVFWLEPPVVIQGSQNGMMKSSINGKQENLFK